VSASLSSSPVPRDDALAFVFDAYEGVTVRPGKGLPHARAVTDVLQHAGYGEDAQLLGLLHDVVEDTARTVDDVRREFGDPMAAMVGALSEDRAIRHYAQRKRDLRARTMAAGSPAVDVALSDKIASLQEALLTKSSLSDRKLRHYHCMLQLALAAELAPALCEQLHELLARFAAASS
jgi:guanosine-3',5'-bis(diphosphate) 3'-pyrophosphohydrolase